MIDLKSEIITLLKRADFYAQRKIELEKVNEAFKRLIEQYPRSLELKFFYNEFRVAYAANLSKTRPQILISSTIRSGFIPNIHMIELFGVADVVRLKLDPRNSPDHYVLSCHPHLLFTDILKRLPRGFNPDFFWDNQVEKEHFIPYGIEKAPFPIVASLCHTYFHKSIEQVCEIFDFVLPLSQFHRNILSKKYERKIIDLPFGLNWGALDFLLSPQWEKSIDVCLTFPETSHPVYEGKRNHVVKCVKEFKRKYGDRFSIVIANGLSKNAYIDLLKKSWITVNCTGVNGPYNYRTIEAMCCGSMVFQYDWDGFFLNKFSELFIDGVHGVGFDFENFEKKLIFYLEHRDQTEKIAKAGYEYLVENFSYKKLYPRLIDCVKQKNIHLPRENETASFRIYMIYYNQASDMIHNLSHVVFNALPSSESWFYLNNLMVLSAIKIEGSTSFLFQNKIFSTWYELCAFYKNSLDQTPAQYRWIMSWNFLLISLEETQVEKKELEEMRSLLQKTDPEPFDEHFVIFKYYVHSVWYPEYKIPEPSSFFSLNIELMKCVSETKKRALLHRDYALAAIEYFLNHYPEIPLY